jgi:hypothetical protein
VQACREGSRPRHRPPLGGQYGSFIIPNNIELTSDKAEKDFAFRNGQHQLRDWLSSFRNDDRLGAGIHIIHDGQAVHLELARWYLLHRIFLVAMVT